MRIAFVTSADPQDKRAWSGTLYFTAEALQKHCGEVTYIAPASAEERSDKKAFYRKMRFLLKKYFAFHPLFLLGRKYFVCNYRIAQAKKFAKVVTRKLAEESGRYDVLVAPASTTEMAFIQTDLPIVLIEDATFASLHNYYPQYSGLPKNAVRDMNALSTIAINKASKLIYASNWAAQSAIHDYHTEPQKVHVVPLGANLEVIPPREIIQQKKKSDTCRLLFIGFDWERKGGDIAFETLLELEKLDIHAELVVCGCTPPKKYSHPRMKLISFLDKNNPVQYKELEQLYINSDFLLLPTRNECYGVVFCEANAFGLPAITTDTGGVSEIVKNGENGFMLLPTARGNEYARLIADIYKDSQRYAKLVLSSRAAYDTRLNWDSWGIHVTQIITDALASRDAAHALNSSRKTVVGRSQ